MDKITVGWIYPNLLNLHGERGSVQALEHVGKQLGIDVQVRRIEDFDDPIPFDEVDLLIFLPGEITLFQHLIPSLNKQRENLDQYLNNGGYLLALGTTGLLFGKQIIREDGSQLECLGYLDVTAKERKYVWGDDLHVRIKGTTQELAGSQIMMADVDTSQPLADTIYGRGNNGSGKDGARWKNLIYTNCLGPLFVKNPWFAESILRDICERKNITVPGNADHSIAENSFCSTLRFIQKKTK
ncbi:MAG: hypothetical protein IKK41_05700 [Oscillospiraceae bacterium]|nr:hypothetical protein [Oscillospiraceae bacterium]